MVIMKHSIYLLISSWCCFFCVLIVCDGEGKYVKKRAPPVKLQESCSATCYPGPGKCYKLCTGGRNIRHAAISCIHNGATILNIEFPGEVRVLSNLIAKGKPGKTEWHIGGKIIKGRWYWFSTVEKKRRVERLSSGANRTKRIKRTKKKYRSFRKPIFLDWQNDVSVNYNKKCLTLYKYSNDTNTFVFASDWCTKKRGINFICQREQSVIPSATVTGICGVKPVGTAASREKIETDNDKITYKIMGGNVVSRGDIPWQARIVSFHPLWDVPVHEGGATILSEYWLLTAAHCLTKVNFRSLLRVVVGDHDVTKWDVGEQVFEIEKVILHWRYVHKQTMAYDIALLMVKPKNGRGIQFNRYAQPACLPSVKTTFRSGLNCTASGWGKDMNTADFTEHLQAAQVPLVQNSTCKKLLRRFSKRRMICAGYPLVQGVDTTIGDSGGPLMCPKGGVNVVAGVTSFGRSPLGYQPGGYTKVQAYLKWIYKNIKTNSKYKKQRKLPKWPKT